MSQLVKAAMAAMVILVTGSTVRAQQEKNAKQPDVPKGWHLLDETKDGYFGISLNQAYDFFHSKNLKPKTVVVAIIDSGIDTLHEDLKDILWTNPGEIPGNGIDDDGNGYVDDIHGWNFLGNKDGRNVKEDSYEGARVYHKLKAKYEGKDIDTATLSPDDKYEYEMWVKAKASVQGDDADGGVNLALLQRAYSTAQKSDSILRTALNKDVYTGNDLDTFQASTSLEKSAKGALLYLFRANKMMETTNKEFMDGFGEFVSGEERKAEAREKAPEDYREEVTGDDESDINDSLYGNNDVMASTPFHGTHVAGIIAAERTNGKGIDGIADDVRVMMIRAVPDGDEHDKDIALAIRYAVDNGAKVVNMSFGKDFSPRKKWVDAAVRYAQSRGVLLVHAAGNDGKDVDTADNFPNPYMLDGEPTATNWITVGASGDPKADGMIASFSNYGKKSVDVFAPGVKIYSSIPGGDNDQYGNAQGTSMASPVVAGTAALLLEYFPYLTPQQLKYCIMKSAQKPGFKVTKPGTDEKVDMSDLAVSGGVINAYQAAMIAYSLKPEVKESKRKKRAPKSTMKNTRG